ncbi:hypothetical protein E2C01_013147 [Portunus trituberculatus]|uniref:Uncharacterized protein n=1 Tax=Portunus trituberculatus TaxID=210409 RepID=A0A5B7DFF9_PORTR|nr:hypothetical protein [Portunus trituberculatus]
MPIGATVASDERRESLGVPAVTSQVLGAPEEERCGQQVKWMSVIVVRARRLDVSHRWLTYLTGSSLARRPASTNLPSRCWIFDNCNS